MNFSDKASIPEHVLARHVGDETVILDLASGTYFGLDAVGARIWQLVSDGMSFAEIRDVMLAEYDVSLADIERDIAALAANLQSYGLIAGRPQS